MIKKNPELKRTKLKALFSMSTGLTYRKIEEYLMELVDADLIEINPDDHEDIKAR